MVKYAYAERVIKKVKQLLKYDNRLREIVNNNPSINLNSQCYLESIVWNYYELQVLATSRGIYYVNRANRETITTYNGFDELLNIR